MTETDARLCTLTAADSAFIEAALDVDPVTDIFLDDRIRPALRAGQLRDDLIGWVEADGQHSLCWLGANVIPTASTSDDAADAFAATVRARNLWFSSLWGPRRPVSRMWSRLGAHVRRPRAVRDLQYFMTLDRDPDVAPDPRIVRVGMRHFDSYYAASVQFTIEELGQSPELYGGGAYYKSRVRSLISAGRAFALIVDGQVLAKADLALATRSASQVQGVWIDPDLRGRGLAEPLVAAAAIAGRQEVAPVVTLYVNAFNTPAYRAYRRLGFVETAEFMTLMW